MSVPHTATRCSPRALCEASQWEERSGLTFLRCSTLDCGLSRRRIASLRALTRSGGGFVLLADPRLKKFIAGCSSSLAQLAALRWSEWFQLREGDR